jgi:transposase
MVKNKEEMKKKVKENIIKIKDDKNKIREYTKKCRLNGRVKFVLNMLSHYKFRQQLLNKSQEHGCKVDVITEEFTSQCCGKCGKLSNNYNKREKECIYCHAKINRDVNGARNILIKNYNKWLK